MSDRLTALAREYQRAKQNEETAVAERRRIAKLIEDEMPGQPEGTTSLKLDGFKVSVARKVTRNVDTAALQDAWEFISENVQNAFKWKAEVDLKHWRALEELKTDAYKEASKFVTSKPAASTVTVEAIAIATQE
jgi:predicted NUDIX family NTP pyrophosphohydrolase